MTDEQWIKINQKENVKEYHKYYKPIRFLGIIILLIILALIGLTVNYYKIDIKSKPIEKYSFIGPN